MIRVGLVGFGLAGKVFHAPIISAVEGLELAAVVERNSRNAESAYPEIATYPSLEKMLGDTTLQLIVVATPNPTHGPMSLEALAAGRHVVVDKPVALNSAEMGGLMVQARECERFLIPFHNRRWDSDFRTLHKLLHEESLGRVIYLESTFDRWRPHPRHTVWRENGSAGGGNLLDLGTHLADQALVLFGLPEAVSAEVDLERDGALSDDAFTLRLGYRGLTVCLSANCLAALPRARYTVRGTGGNYQKWGLDLQEARLRDAGRVVEPGWGVEPHTGWGTLAVDVEGSTVTCPVMPMPGDYRLFYAGVRDAILGKSKPPVEALDAWQVLRLLEWAIESSNRRQEVACAWETPPAP